MAKQPVNGHDYLCLHSKYVQMNLSPMICTYCALIRDVRAERYGVR